MKQDKGLEQKKESSKKERLGIEDMTCKMMNAQYFYWPSIRQLNVCSTDIDS